jgi:hypothetical protein
VADNKDRPQVTQSSNSNETPLPSKGPTVHLGADDGIVDRPSLAGMPSPSIAELVGHPIRTVERKAFSMPRDDAIFWVGLTLFGGGLSMTSAHPIIGVILLIVGIMALVWANRGHMPRPSLRFTILILAMLITTGLSGYDLYDRYFGNPAPDAAKAINSLQAEKDKLQAELTSATTSRDALQQQLKNLPPQAAAPAASPYLHLTDARRWQIVKTLIDGADLPHGCAIIQSLNNDGTPEFRKTVETWGEVQQPLQYARWHFIQGNRSFIPPGIGIVVTSKTGPAGMCGTRLKDLLDGLNISPVSFRIDPSSLSLAQCPDNNCIEVIIGKLESP